MVQFFIWLSILLLFTGATVVSGYKAKEAWDNWHRDDSSNTARMMIQPTIKNVNGDFVSGDKTVIGAQINNNTGNMSQFPTDNDSKIEVVKLRIKRAFEDYEQAVEDIKKNFPQESEAIAHKYNLNGVLSSGMHIKAQMDLSVATKVKLEGLLTNLERSVEDILIENFGKTTFASINGDLNDETQRLDKAKNGLHEIYKLLTDSPKSWEMKALGEQRLTKDFNL
ncbi:MAG: hypothetical protein HZC18_00405 [Candidatus Omnitrophica bacterium]|nr:hypothetical protein [Candidatus Omnitrophota bacterium]